MVLSSRFLMDDNKCAGTIRSGNLLRGLRTGLAAATIGLFIIGLAPASAQAQLTIDHPSATGITVLTGLDGNNVVGLYSTFAAGIPIDHGFIYDGQTFKPLDAPNSLRTDPFAISGNRVVGSYTDNTGHDYGFLYDGTVFTTLDVAGSVETAAHGIDGSNIVGEYVDGTGHVLGFLYDGATYKTLDGPTGAVETVPFGISGNKIVGSYQDTTGTDHGFLYDSVTQMYSIFDAPLAGTGFDIGTYASTIQGDLILGSYTDANNINHGFLYDGMNFSTLDHPLAGTNPFLMMSGTFAFGFSNGRVAGTYFDAFGSHGYILPVASLVPEPGSLALVGGGSVSLLAFARRRRRK